MITEGRDNIRELIAHFADEEVDGGIRFLRIVTGRSSEYGPRPLNRPKGNSSEAPAYSPEANT
jgi:hypothetical protein